MHHFFRFTSQEKLGLLFGFVASVLALGLLTSPAFAASIGSNSQSLKGSWKLVPSPGKGVLSGVAVISANDVWSVGNQGLKTLTEHWDGSAWKIVASPNQGTNDTLNGVAAISTSDVWTVGWQYFPKTSAYTPLIEHWDGTKWSLVPSPKLKFSGYLSGVAAVSSSDVWAVGYQGAETLIEQWNGSSWNVVSSTGFGKLNSVAVVSASDIWAVGTNNHKTLTEHWNGTNWSVVASPSPGSTDNVLESVSVVSTNDIWAVGYQTIHKFGTLAEHWNGTAWKVVPGPNIRSGPGGTLLDAVAAVSTNNVWAVGNYSTGDAYFSPVIEHWNGSKWSVVNGANAGNYNGLPGLAAVPGSTNLWAVGFYSFNGPDKTFTEYYG